MLFNVLPPPVVPVCEPPLSFNESGTERSRELSLILHGIQKKKKKRKTGKETCKHRLFFPLFAKVKSCYGHFFVLTTMEESAKSDLSTYCVA